MNACCHSLLGGNDSALLWHQYNHKPECLHNPLKWIDNPVKKYLISMERNLDRVIKRKYLDDE